MDFALTTQQQELQALARTFATEEVRPTAREYEQRRDPAQCLAPQLFVRADELGLRTMPLPREYGGMEVDLLTEVIVHEELCAGDAGFGMGIQHSWREGKCLAVLTSDSQRERYLPGFLANPLHFTARAQAEPELGSDSASGYTGDLRAGPRTTARREGDDWILDGTKQWITNGNIAEIYMIVARTDPTVPWTRGTTVFLVPKGTPGLVPGKSEDKIGVRTNQNAGFMLADVVVPDDDRLGELNRGSEMMRAMGVGSRAKEAALALGITRAAYEELVALVERAPGPVDQSLDDVLAVMAIEIEATRSFVWRAVWGLQNDVPGASDLERMAFVKASDVCKRITNLLMDVHGPDGLIRGSLAEKLVRDAATILHAGGGKHAVRARIGAGLHH